MRDQHRELSRRRRASARTLASAFPAVEGVRVELSFETVAGRAPARQSHLLYPPAAAYFQFDCPHGDCDGGFDLNDTALLLMTGSTAHGDGTLECKGSRAAAGLLRQPCGLRAHFRIVVQYATKGA